MINVSQKVALIREIASIEELDGYHSAARERVGGITAEEVYAIVEKRREFLNAKKARP